MAARKLFGSTRRAVEFLSDIEWAPARDPAAAGVPFGFGLWFLPARPAGMNRPAGHYIIFYTFPESVARLISIIWQAEEANGS